MGTGRPANGAAVPVGYQLTPPHPPPGAGARSTPSSRALVTHGGCVRAATAHLTGADPRRLAPPANASLTVIEYGERTRLHAYGLRAPGPETPGLA